jgi:hypothetical protein
MLNTKKSFLSFLICGLLSVVTYGQKPLDLAESAIKVGLKAEEAVFFGFAAGDQLIFSFEEANGKEMKEVEIIEMPNSSKFMDVKTSKIENKTISVPRTGIYKFRFANSALLPRLCKYKIQRIPGSPATQNFNSTVYYDTYNDTSYSTEIESYISKSDTIINNLQERNIKVNPTSAPGTSKATFNFMIPENAVTWSYYITAEKAGQVLYQDAGKNIVANADPSVTKYTSYSPLAAVALDRQSYLTRIDSGMRINYWIVEDDNADLFMTGGQFRFIKKGRAVNDFSKMEPGGRLFNFCFHNDYKDAPITVTVKITAIGVNETLASREVKRMYVTPKNGMHLKN